MITHWNQDRHIHENWSIFGRLYEALSFVSFVFFALVGNAMGQDCIGNLKKKSFCVVFCFIFLKENTWLWFLFSNYSVKFFSKIVYVILKIAVFRFIYIIKNNFKSTQKPLKMSNVIIDIKLSQIHKTPINLASLKTQKC